MDLEIKTEWPETAPGIMGNPVNIEKFLKEEITSRQVTLIGELDLVAETSYAGVGWSLYEFASYLANKNMIKHSLTAERLLQFGLLEKLKRQKMAQSKCGICKTTRQDNSQTLQTCLRAPLKFLDYLRLTASYLELKSMSN